MISSSTPPTGAPQKQTSKASGWGDLLVAQLHLTVITAQAPGAQTRRGELQQGRGDRRIDASGDERPLRFGDVEGWNRCSASRGTRTFVQPYLAVALIFLVPDSRIEKKIEHRAEKGGG